MSDNELDWQKNVKPIVCQKVTLNQPTSQFVHDEKFSEETHNNIFDASFSTKKIELRKRSNVDYQMNLNKCNHSFFSQKSSPYTSLSCSLDHNTKLKVDRGEYFIDAKLDLHGCHIDDAYYKLVNFIIKNYQIGNRCLLVITGHGNSTNKVGAIKNNLHKWLNDTKIYYMVLYFQQATKKHGGKGAFYVLLRRNKNLDTTFKK